MDDTPVRPSHRHFPSDKWDNTLLLQSNMLVALAMEMDLDPSSADNGNAQSFHLHLTWSSLPLCGL
eukprot:1157571-Pleurochrysis_carterae.AAC.1